VAEGEATGAGGFSNGAGHAGFVSKRAQ